MKWCMGNNTKSFLHRLGIRLAIYEHFLDATAAGRGHNHLGGKFADRIARALGDVIAFLSSLSWKCSMILCRCSSVMRPAS